MPGDADDSIEELLAAAAVAPGNGKSHQLAFFNQ